MSVTTRINGSEFELSTKLRVAYKIQGCHNHKSYVAVFQDVGKMTLEEQIEILFVAFQDANPDMTITLNKKAFLDYYLEHFTLKQVMNQLQAVIKGIMGEDDAEPENTATNQGN